MVINCKNLPFRIVVCWTAVLSVSVASAIGIARLARPMAPIHRGNSHQFWNCACGVVLSSEADSDWGGDAYFVDDVWAAYEMFHMHGGRVFCVPLLEVSSDFDAVVDKLQKQYELEKRHDAIKGYVRWRDDAKLPRDGQTLLKCIQREYLRSRVERGIASVEFSVQNEQLFWQRWQRADWYWASIVFEWMFLSGLALFAMWPGIRNRSVVRWAIHIAFLPFLFLTPAYLGYATFSFTSAGPSGGILYPYLLMFLRNGSMTEFDGKVLRYIPRILEPLSAPIGSPMALTFLGMPGPTSVISAGVICGVALLAIQYGVRWRVRRQSDVSRQSGSHLK